MFTEEEKKLLELLVVEQINRDVQVVMAETDKQVRAGTLALNRVLIKLRTPAKAVDLPFGPR